MSEFVTLHNKGQRLITVAGHQFKPGTSVQFPAAVAERLRKLYRDEVEAPADALKPFHAPEKVAASPAAVEEPKGTENSEDADKAAADAEAQKEAEKAAKAADKAKKDADKKAKADAEKAAKAAAKANK